VIHYVVGNYILDQIGFSNLVGTGYPAIEPPLFSYGIYDITVRKNKDGDEINFSIDFLDCEWPGLGGYPCGNDIYLYYIGDDTVEIFPSSNCDTTTVTQGGKYTLWDLKGKTTAACKDSFELYLEVSTQNNHPYLTWNAYADRSGNDDDVDYYEIWKRKDSAWFEKDTTSYTYYEDTSEDATAPGVKKYAYYKILAVENDEDHSFFGNEVKKAVYEPREEGKAFLENGSSIISKDNKPTKYSLKQNYPNPFNPTTTISFDLQKEGTVQLEIFNVQGKIVSTLVNGTMDQGNHNVRFNSSGLPSGVYFYRLQTQEFTDIKRMLLLR
jgi:hypothetical protein